MHVSGRSVRNHTAAVFAGFATFSFLVHLILFFIYLSSRPRVPNTALGQVHPFNNHGSFVYVSQSEATGLSLLMIAFFAWGLSAAAIAAKTFVVTPRTQFPL
jgi:acyl transferase domain-containing protein